MNGQIICIKEATRKYSDGFIHYMRAIQGHSGRYKVDPSLLDNVEITYMWSEFIYHVGDSLDLHSTQD